MFDTLKNIGEKIEIALSYTLGKNNPMEKLEAYLYPKIFQYWKNFFSHNTAVSLTTYTTAFINIFFYVVGAFIALYGIVVLHLSSMVVGVLMIVLGSLIVFATMLWAVAMYNKHKAEYVPEPRPTFKRKNKNV